MNTAGLPLDPALLPAFLLAVALVELTPGPNMGFLAVLSASRGRRAGLSALAGITLGLAVYMVAAALGLTEVLLVYPPLFEALRWVGVAYILWLAVETWRGPAEVPPGHDWRLDGGRFFWRGFLANILNPKAAVFYVLLLPRFIAPDRASPLVQALLLGSAHILLSVVVHFGIVMGAARLGKLASNHESARRITRRLFALALALVAAWLAFDQR